MFYVPKAIDSVRDYFRYDFPSKMRDLEEWVARGQIEDAIRRHYGR